ncbi:hypothetical protein HYW75_00440, partial [Candidatus Pacearchaeota archaeon]|nr:hypothetical protein [Candidatus Pacearchaeota archaeon]
LKHSYIVYVKAEDDICNEAIQKIKIEKPEHKVIIKSLDIQEEIRCNSDIEINARIKNLGDNEESILIMIENPDLGIEIETDQFILEENGERDSTNKNLIMHIPEDVEGDYMFKTTLDYGIDNVVIDNNVSISCDVSENNQYSNSDQSDYISIGEIEPAYLSNNKIIEGTYKSNLALDNSSLNSSELLIIILSALNIIFIIGILYMSKWLKL